jgi:hypothetical protein
MTPASTSHDAPIPTPSAPYVKTVVLTTETTYACRSAAPATGRTGAPDGR